MEVIPTHGLPENFNSDFFLGRTLELFCFTSNQIYLHFERAIMVTIEGQYSFQQEHIAALNIRAVPDFDPSLFQLLDHSVRSASAETNGTLTLTFDNGAILRLYDTPEPYESYQIKNGDSITVV